MAVPKNISSIKRFGTRYGRTTKYKLGEIESQYKKKLKCPYCKKLGIKKEAAGIWTCNKCNAKFAGKAFSIE